MPKAKSHRGAMKRFKRTASGQIKRGKAYASHFLTKKTRRRKRRLRQSGVVAQPDLRRIRRLLAIG
jgi:large subunit ribosomal protein L35